MANEEIGFEQLQAELLVEAREVILDTKKAELVAKKILAAHSTQLKVALSELALSTATELRSAGVKPKDKALALAALRSVGTQLYGWDKEPGEQEVSKVWMSAMLTA
jgi:hypothetical protein